MRRYVPFTPAAVALVVIGVMFAHAQNQSAGRRVVEQYTEAINARNLDRLLFLFSPNAQVTHPAPAWNVSGRAALKPLFVSLLKSFPDLQLRIRSVVSHENHLAVEWLVSGTYREALPGGPPPRGQKIEYPLAAFLGIQNGQIQTVTFYYDRVAVARQYGKEGFDFWLASWRAELTQTMASPSSRSPSPLDGITLEEARQQKPPPPSGLTAAATSEGVRLRWRAVRSSIASYNVYRKGSGTEFQQVGARKSEEKVELSEMGTYDFTDTKVRPGTTYTYAVTAVNVYGNESDKSEPATITAK